MRIVIIGEYSGFSKSLNKGLRQLGHESFVFSWGDWFKKIEPDNYTYLINDRNFSLFGKMIKGSSRIRRPISALKLYHFYKEKFRHDKADVILVLNVAFLKESNNIFIPKFSNDMLLYMSTSLHNIYMSACGNDYIVNSFLPFCKRTNEFMIYFYLNNIEKQKEKFDNHIKYVKGIIPIAHDYAMAYAHQKKMYGYCIYPTIPLPFDVHSVNYQNVVYDKIVIMHGMNRPYEKGSYIIISALNRIQKDFPNKVDIRIVKNLPLKKYLKVLENANIVVDQCYGCSNGMNTIESLSMGKVVLSGNSKEYHQVYTALENPVIDIEPNSEQIYQAMRNLVLNPKLITDISKKSRLFAEAIHDCVGVAKKYIEIFGR